MTTDSDGRNSRDTRYHKAVDGLRSGFIGLARLLMVEASTGIVLSVKQRGEYDWLALAKREHKENGPQVCFGFGVGPIEALCHLDGQVQSGSWRVDKPWQG